jgi:hypothetical protein
LALKLHMIIAELKHEIAVAVWTQSWQLSYFDAPGDSEDQSSGLTRTRISSFYIIIDSMAQSTLTFFFFPFSFWQHAAVPKSAKATHK